MDACLPPVPTTEHPAVLVTYGLRFTGDADATDRPREKRRA